MPRPFPPMAADPCRVASPDLATSHSLVIDGKPEQVGAARAFVRRVLGSGHPGAERVSLLTSELVTNSVLHSDSRMEGGTVTVRLRVGAERILVEVLDDGASNVPTLRSDDDMAESGRGLRLVNACSAAWGFRQSAAHRHLVRVRARTAAVTDALAAPVQRVVVRGALVSFGGRVFGGKTCR